MKRTLLLAQNEFNYHTSDSTERISHLEESHRLYQKLEGTKFNDCDIFYRTTLYLQFKDYDGAIRYIASIRKRTIDLLQEDRIIRVIKYSSDFYENRDSVDIIAHQLLNECIVQYERTGNKKWLQDWVQYYFILSSRGDEYWAERWTAASKEDLRYLAPWIRNAQSESLFPRIPFN